MVCTGLHWFALVCTGLHWFALVCTGSNRKCDQFPWFDPVPGRSCLLPVKYKFPAVYRSADYSCMFPKWVQNDCKCCDPINKPRNFIIWKVIYHSCSKIWRLRSTQIKYSTIFYLHNQKTPLNGANQAFPWCAPPLSVNHWVRTEWVRMSTNQFWFHGSHRVFIRTGANHGLQILKPTTSKRAQYPAQMEA